MTHIKIFTKILSSVLLLFAMSTAAKAQDKGAGHKIVFQLTDNNPSSHKSLTNQLKNIKEGWPEAQIEVVVHSAGISYLMETKTQHASEIRALSELGVKFMACENTLEAKNISKKEILEVSDFVPMGIAEVVLKQEKGWSYIKAGL